MMMWILLLLMWRFAGGVVGSDPEQTLSPSPTNAVASHSVGTTGPVTSIDGG